MFSCEFCKISKNTFSYRTPMVAASVFIEIGYCLSLYNYKENLWSFMIYFEENVHWNWLPNLTTYVFKGHVKMVKIYMLKFNVSILNSLKIMGFL